MELSNTVLVFITVILNCLLGVDASIREISVLGSQNSVITLSCNIPVGVESNTIQWMHNGNPITVSSNSKYTVSSTRLQIRGIIASDEGVYTCTYGPSAYRITAAHVYVLGAAEFLENETQEVNVYAGDSPMFDTRLSYVGAGPRGRSQSTTLLQLYRASPTGGPPTLLYSCLNFPGFENMACTTRGRISVVLPPNSSHKFDVFLRLHEATESDAGVYIARAEIVNPGNGGISYIQKQINLNIHELPSPPEVVLQHTGSPIDGNRYSLTCQAEFTDPSIEYTHIELQWTDSEGNVLSTGNQTNITVTFEPLRKLQHDGQYACSVVVALNNSEVTLMANKTTDLLVEAPARDEEDFQISIGPVDLQQCTNWVLDTAKGAQLEEAIRQEISRVVSSRCGSDCEITAGSIETRHMKCLDNLQLGYRGTFSSPSTSSLSASEFITHIESWLNSRVNPVFQLGWFVLDLDTNCPIRVPTDATCGWCSNCLGGTEATEIPATAAPPDNGCLTAQNHTVIAQCVTTCLATL